jgi:hypothetical protein
MIPSALSASASPLRRSWLGFLTFTQLKFESSPIAQACVSFGLGSFEIGRA